MVKFIIYISIVFALVVAELGVARVEQVPSPTKRRDAATWTVGGKLYLFGGLGWSRKERVFGSPFNDLWEYDPQTNKWTLLSGDEKSGARSTESAPGGRSSSTSWTIDKKLYLYGGIGVDLKGKSGASDEMWVFDLEKTAWKKLYGEGTANLETTRIRLGGRWGAAGWVVDKKLTLFGGACRGNFSDGPCLHNDLWEFDITSNEWRDISGNREKDRPRVRAAPTYWKVGNKLYLYGGYSAVGNKFGKLGDLWEYVTEGKRWYKIHGAEEGGSEKLNVERTDTWPGGVSQHSGWVLNGKLFLFGSQYSNELWEFDPQIENNKTWKVVYGKKEESATTGVVLGLRTGSATWVIDNKVYLYGGSGYRRSQSFEYYENLDDLWVFEDTKWRWLTE